MTVQNQKHWPKKDTNKPKCEGLCLMVSNGSGWRSKNDIGLADATEVVDLQGDEDPVVHD